MRDDSCLHFRHDVSNPDQVKCITLELYFTFKLSAGEDVAFQFEFSFTFTSDNLVILVIRNVDKYVVLTFTDC